MVSEQSISLFRNDIRILSVGCLNDSLLLDEYHFDCLSLPQRRAPRQLPRLAWTYVGHLNTSSTRQLQC